MTAPNPYLASHTSNPSSVPQGYVNSYSTLPWIMWEAVTCVEGHPDEGYYDTRWLTGLWSIQAMVEGIVLKAVWHWVSDCGAVNDPLGEPGSTPLYARLSSPWGSMGHDQIISAFLFWGSRSI